MADRPPKSRAYAHYDNVVLGAGFLGWLSGLAIGVLLFA
jgi:hypothetical protein